MISETDKAWIAGFLDGEGNISIQHQKAPPGRSPVYRHSVQLTQTHHPSLEFLQAEYGGKIYDHHDKRSSKFRPAWYWRCPYPEVSRLIHDVLPYLRIKNEEAKVVLEYVEDRKFERPLSEDEIAWRYSMYQKYREAMSRRKSGVV